MITQHEYQGRRTQLIQRLSADAVAIIPAASELIRNGDAHYRFRQDSSFYYLTGFNEPDALLVIASGQSILFSRPRNLEEEQWTGKRLGQEGALTELLMDEAHSIDQVADELPRLLSNQSAIYSAIGRNKRIEKQIRAAWLQVKSQSRKGVKAPEALCDLEPILSEMRLFKSEAEIELMRRAALVSAMAHQCAMKQCKKLQFEYELEAELIYEFARQGCHSVAYNSIVGAGPNACTLHYEKNNAPLISGDLVLIDAGCEYENYAADITRTFPINGRFSPAQKSIYELVLKAQRAGIAAIKPGLLWHEIQRIIIEILTAGLCELGILTGAVDELITQAAYRPFYMHSSGHWLGLDVHDCGSYKVNGDWRPLEPGMVLTVEPGLYISADRNDVDKQWRGIGVRIEDDVLVTQEGHELLTAALPVETDDIEALMRD